MSLAVKYQGISIGENMNRTLAKLIKNRLKKAYVTHIGNEKFGFQLHIHGFQ